MKNKTLSILFPFAVLLTIISGNNSNAICEKINRGYIRLEYAGDVEKPHPVVIFYLAGSIDTAYSNFFTHKIRVTEMEFKGIKESIEDRKFESKDSLKGNYQFIIFCNGKETFVLTKSITTLQQILKNILKQFKDINKEKLVKNRLDEIVRRLGYPDVLD
jgi:hypothetical protein